MESVQEQKYTIMSLYQRNCNNNVDEEEKYVSEDESNNSSFFGDSNNSKDSSSSLDLLDDASSSSSSSSSSPLYGLSKLMDQLPIKQGLSKFYNGKSQSFTTLARVTSIEDLAKKETPYQRRLKACKSYGGGLNNFKYHTHPKPTISKKVSKGSLSNLCRKNSFILGS
ncbi:hypothetical protein RND81_11G118300 [Saponaria officinalis]|uniref:Oxidative stress 3 n=1 Tax=Saponaria officinalis TaxID=3572 RepID=A0AAW1HL07_SAPOF